MKYDFPTPEGTMFPSMTVVSIINVCDFACTHCFYPQYVKQRGYSRHNMETAVFRKIADEMGQYPGSILRFIAWGEPLLHPKMIEFTQYANQVAPCSPISLITNGYWLKPDISKALMMVGLDLIEVSIDAATPETYSRIRVSKYLDAFSRVEQNVKEMVCQRNELGLKTRITVSFIVRPTKESVDEYAIFEQRWGGVADEIIKRKLHTFKGTVPAIAFLPSPRQPCYGLWTRCNINPWGQMSVCYNDWENKNVLGDLIDPGVTIAGVWQGTALARLRANQQKKIFTGICKTCKDYNADAWNHPYEQVVDRCRNKGL
ncbi:radical SAM protein [Patescibacteria group bacterium]|nr:radical SAM protein [Patescibacteria group bacterium]